MMEDHLDLLKYYKDFILDMDELCDALYTLKTKGFFYKSLNQNLQNLKNQFSEILRELYYLNSINVELNNKTIIVSCIVLLEKLYRNIDFIIERKFLTKTNLRRIYEIRLNYETYRAKKNEERREIMSTINFYRRCIDRGHNGHFENVLHNLLLKINSILGDRYRIDFFHALEIVKFSFIDPVYGSCERIQNLIPEIINKLSIKIDGEDEILINNIDSLECSNITEYKNNLINDIKNSLVGFLEIIDQYVIDFEKIEHEFNCKCTLREKIPEIAFGNIIDLLVKFLVYYTFFDKNVSIKTRIVKKIIEVISLILVRYFGYWA